MGRFLEKQKGELTDFDLFWQEKGKRDGGEYAQIKNCKLAKKLNYLENMVILHKFAAYTKETTDGTMAKDTNTAR